MNRRTVRLTVRLTPEENQRLTQAARERGYQGVAQFARASLARWVTQAQVIEEVHSLEKRQAATLSAVRTEIGRFQRTEYVVFAMLENLAKTLLTYMPPPAAENKASVIAQGRAGYERYLKAVGMSLHNGSRDAVDRLAGLDE
jgi:uncharacterized protein (DUF1778 family)